MKEYKHISYEIIEPFLVKVGSAISTSQAKNLLKALGNTKSRKAYKNTLAKQETFLTDLKYLSRENPAALRQQGININQNELNQMLDSVNINIEMTGRERVDAINLFHQLLDSSLFQYVDRSNVIRPVVVAVPTGGEITLPKDDKMNNYRKKLK